MCAPHIHVCGEREDACLLVDVVRGCCSGVTGGNSECCVLCSLEFLNVCGGCARGPDCVGVCEDGSDELFV